MGTQFDPGSYYQFELSKGEVTSHKGRRMLVLSDSVLKPLVTAAARNGDLTPLRILGREIGEEVLSELDPKSVPMEEIVGRLAAAISLCGWGKFGMSRWGDAMVVSLEHSPVLDADSLATAAFLGGCFSAIAAREVACVPLEKGAKYLVVDPTIAESVWGWARAGQPVAEVVGRLSGASS